LKLDSGSCQIRHNIGFNEKPGHNMNKAVVCSRARLGVRRVGDDTMKNLATYENYTLTMINMEN
jgi:hypothetical protein